MLKNSKVAKCLQSYKPEVFNLSVTKSDQKILFKVFLLDRNYDEETPCQ